LRPWLIGGQGRSNPLKIPALRDKAALGPGQKLRGRARGGKGTGGNGLKPKGDWAPLWKGGKLLMLGETREKARVIIAPGVFNKGGFFHRAGVWGKKNPFFFPKRRGGL